jgi:hypothetical protein
MRLVLLSHILGEPFPPAKATALKQRSRSRNARGKQGRRAGKHLYFGSYSVNEADKTITTHIEVCSFPNWVGHEVKSSYTINGDELRSTTSGSSVGEGTVRVVWKRAK